MRMSFLGIFLLFGSAAAIAAVVLFVCGIKETLIKSIQTTLSNGFSCGRIDGKAFNQRFLKNKKALMLATAVVITAALVLTYVMLGHLITSM